jgi:hypothetical protein
MIDYDYGAVGGMRIGRGNRSTRRKPAPVPPCSPQNPHDLGSNPGSRGGKPATNRLSYGTAEENDLVPQQDSGCRGRESNRSLSSYRSEVLPLKRAPSVV